MLRKSIGGRSSQGLLRVRGRFRVTVRVKVWLRVRVRGVVRVRRRVWFRVRFTVSVRVRARFRVPVRIRVRVRVRVVIKPIPLSRYPLARKGMLFGGPAMEKRLDTRRR